MIKYFKQLEFNNTKKAKVFTKYSIVSDGTQEMSYKVAKKYCQVYEIPYSYRIGHFAGMLCNSKNNVWKWIWKRNFRNTILSDNIISQCIKVFLENIELQVISHLKKMNVFAQQLNESVDVTDKSQHLAFGRFIYEEEIIEVFILSTSINNIKSARYFPSDW